MYRIALLAAVLLMLFRPSVAESGEINFLTDLLSPFPPGCVAFSLPEEPASADNTLVDDFIDVPSIGSSTEDEEVRVTIWRVGCADEGYSVVMVRLQHVTDGPDVLVPRVFAEAGQVDLPNHEAQLIRLPAVGPAGATGGEISRDGTTFMLAVDQIGMDGSTDFFPVDYNDDFTLELWWGHYAPVEAYAIYDLEAYVPSLDPPQFDEPVLHGRYNGQWVADGVPRTGLGLNVGETLNDENFYFVTFYTYLDGEPFWVTGNTGARPAEPGPVTMEMIRVAGGEFFTDPNQPSSNQLVEEVIGSITITPLDCNRLEVAYDFAQGGLGTGAMEFVRAIRTAGYDCNPWE